MSILFPSDDSDYNKDVLGALKKTKKVKTKNTTQVIGGYIDKNNLICVPVIPKTADTSSNGNGGSNANNGLVKTANTNNYEEKVQETKADFSIEERVAFMALTGTEVLEVSRNFNMSSNSLSLNKNVLDSVAIVNAANPIELIRTQNSNNDYLSNSSASVQNTAVTIAPTTGTVTVTVPAVEILTTPAQPATTTVTPATPVNTNQVQAQVTTPAEVVPQTTTPPHKIISFTPVEGKKGTGTVTGTKITVTHERCNATPQPKIVIGPTATATPGSIKTTTFTFTIPANAALVVGQSYKLSMTIGGVKAESTQTLKII